MKSDKPEECKSETKKEFYKNDYSLFSILLLSLVMAFFALCMLLWVPSQVTYKNVGSLSELNSKKVRYYTENQNIHLIFKSGGNPDTIRTLSDYRNSIEKENVLEEVRRMDDYLASVKEKRSYSSNSVEVSETRTSYDESSQPTKYAISNPTFLDKSRNLKVRTSSSQFLITKPDKKPEFPNGMRGIELYLARNKRTPLKAKSQNVKGTVDLKFIVKTDGSLSDIQVLKGLGFGCEEEAVRLVKNMPAWKPGMKDKQPVNCYGNLSIKF